MAPFAPASLLLGALASLILTARCSASTAAAAGRLNVVERHPGDPVVAREPAEGIAWHEFGFSLNGVRTEQMFLAKCRAGENWLPGSIVAHAALQIEPAATVLNYGQALFEGLKALRREDGSITLFRPDMNAKRMAMGAERLCIPPVPEDVFVGAVIATIQVGVIYDTRVVSSSALKGDTFLLICKTWTIQANSQWVPPYGEGCLYLRPVLFGSGAGMGVGPSSEYTFCVYW